MTAKHDCAVLMTHAVDDGTEFTLDTVPVGVEFDVMAHLEVGADIADWKPPYAVTTFIRNLTKSATITQASNSGNVPDTTDPNPWTKRERLDIAAGWDADPGDVLEAMTVFVVGEGNNEDYSVQTSGMFIVT